MLNWCRLFWIQRFGSPISFLNVHSVFSPVRLGSYQLLLVWIKSLAPSFILFTSWYSHNSDIYLSNGGWCFSWAFFIVSQPSLSSSESLLWFYLQFGILYSVRLSLLVKLPMLYWLSLNVISLSSIHLEFFNIISFFGESLCAHVGLLGCFFSPILELLLCV